jgi:hypothetical protein
MISKYTHIDCLVVENTVIISEQGNFSYRSPNLILFLTQSRPLEEVSKYSIRFCSAPSKIKTEIGTDVLQLHFLQWRPASGHIHKRLKVSNNVLNSWQ